jgi:pSer/pThr/pTyr-binding forkhead associated (FHA) protein
VLTIYKGEYYAKDENSTYGTMVDGEALEKGKPTLLKDGSVISLGPKVKVLFQLIPKD